MVRLLFVTLTISFVLTIHNDGLCQNTEFQSDLVFESAIQHVSATLNDKDYTGAIGFIEDLIGSDEYLSLECRHKSMLLHKLGLIYYSVSNFAKAYDIFSQLTIPLWETCQNHDQVLEANSNFTAAMSAQFLNKFEEAIPFLNRSLNLYDSDDDYPSFKLGHKYRGAGVLHFNAGDNELSKVFYEKAIVSFNKSKDAEYHIGDTYNDLGLLSIKTGHFEQAVKNFKKSFGLHEELRFKSSFNLANVFIENLNDADQASHYATIAYDMATDLVDYFSIIKANNIKGRIEYKKSNYKEAIEFYTEGINLCDSIIQNNPNVRERANLHEHRAEAYFKSEQYIEAHTEIDKAINLIMPDQLSDNSTIVLDNAIIRDIQDLIEMLSVKADIIIAQESTGQSRNEINKGLQLYYKIDSLFQMSLADISLSNSQIQASSLMTPYYERAIKHHLHLFEQTKNLSYYNSSYYFSSQLKSLILFNTLRKHKKLDDVEDEKLRNLKSHLSELLVNYDSSESDYDSLSSEIIQIQRHIYDFELSLQKKYKTGFNSSDATTLNNVSAIQDQLKKDEVILEFFMGEETMYCFLIGRQQVDYREISLSDKTALMINDFIQSCQDPKDQTIEDFWIKSQDMYKLLLEPLIRPIQDDLSKIIIIPDGLMHALPFEALMISDRLYLLHKYNVVYTYSHRLYFEESNQQTGKNYLGFGPSYSDKLSDKLIAINLLTKGESLADLKMGIREVQASSDYYNEKTIHIEENATKSQFVEFAQHADILHLSMHGLVDYAVPDNSSLVFHDGVEDFVLKSAEITALNMEADLVILSSCHSAAGAITNGEGVQGLSRAFILAGASSVLSSLWSSNEYASSEILPSFFKKLTSGSSKSISLRESKLDYLATARPSLQHPFYWANYILLSHNDIYHQSPKTALYVFLLGLFMTGLILFIRFKSK